MRGASNVGGGGSMMGAIGSLIALQLHTIGPDAQLPNLGNNFSHFGQVKFYIPFRVSPKNQNVRILALQILLI